MSTLKLFPHQTQVLEESKDMNRVAYYLDMGLGKTFVGAEKAKQLGAQFTLLVCPKSLIDTWRKHFETYYGDMIVYDLTTWTDEDWEETTYSPDERYVFIINYELAWRRSQLLDLSRFTLMLDESSVIQNQTSKRSKFILKLNPDNVILLSGTPTSGKYENLWSQAHLIGWKISKTLYDKQYINWKTIDSG